MATPTLTDFTMSDHTTMATVDEGVYYEHSTSLHFADADGDTLTYSATLTDGSILPSWLSMNATTGILSGTPTYNDAASINITVTATDITGGSISDSYTLTVNNTNEVPELVNPESTFQLTKEQENFSFDTSELFYDADGDALTYSAQIVNEYEEYSADTGEFNWVQTFTDLPGWLSIDTQTGVISGTPGEGDATITQVGVYVHTSNDSGDGFDADAVNFAYQGEEGHQIIYSDFYNDSSNYRDVVKNYDSGASIHQTKTHAENYIEISYSKTNELGVVIEQMSKVKTTIWDSDSDIDVRTVKLFDNSGHLTQTTVKTLLGGYNILTDEAGIQFVEFEQGPDYKPYADYVGDFLVNWHTDYQGQEEHAQSLLDNYAAIFDGNNVKRLYVKEYYDPQGELTNTTYVIRGEGFFFAAPYRV